MELCEFTSNQLDLLSANEKGLFFQTLNVFKKFIS